MSKRAQKPVKAATVGAAGYAPLLAELKSRVRTAQVKAALAVNRELIALYWDIGRVILQRQQAEGWGTKVVARLAADLRAEFPEMKGFSERNLNYMIRFAREYGALAILQQPAALLSEGSATPIMPQAAAQFTAGEIVQPAIAQLSPDDPISILQQLAAKLPWFHHVILMEKVKDRAIRLWYMQRAIEHGWSRAVLTVQIETKAHRRMGKAQTNFAQTLPPMQSDLAQQVLKDPYTFDFLTLSAEARERELEQGLTEHIQKFLVELGVGFAFVGRQVHLEVGGEDYYLDLLFYHLKLRCFVVLDLKMEAFKPEFAGKMNFYLTAVDEQMRHANDQPTIGLLLCKEKNRLTVEYALRDVKKPIGVAEWRTRLVESLPKQLRGALPSVEDLERGLADDKP
jgi:predicted nuclease of restriction endonuclease-like (RecB) superfamily